MKIGYARVSTTEQNLDLQLDALKTAGCTRIYEECASGKNARRTELANCLKSLRAGDVGVLGATEQKTGLSRSHRNFDSCGAWSNR